MADAPMLAVTVDETAEVLTLKVWLVCPAGTSKVAGTVAAPLSLVRLTVTPEGPAACCSVTVPVEELPPVTLFGLRLTLRTPAAVMVSGALWLELPRVAVMFAVAVLSTGLVDTPNVWLVWPAGTVTVDGVVAAPLSLPSDTTVPPAGAAALMVTVPVLDWPPITEVGFSEMPVTVGAAAVIVRGALALWPLADAPILAVTVFETAELLTVKVWFT